MSGLTGQAICGPEDRQEARWAKERVETEMGRHLNILLQAQRIRADPALIAQLRAWVREKKDELATVLDDIG
jgi:hypothetical protein